MAYSYYVDGDGNYYEGEKLDPSWTEVTQRAHHLQDWNGAAWAYNLTRTRAYQKAKFTEDLESDLAAAMSEAGIGLMDIAAMCMATAEVVKIGDDPAATDQEVPFLYGYATAASDTKANAATAVGGTNQALAASIGGLYYYKKTVFAAIDASSNAVDILNMNYVRP